MDPVPPSPEHVVFIEGAASLRATTHRKRGERVSSQSEPSDADCPKDHRASLDGGSRWPRSFHRRRRIRACALVAAALLLVLHLLLCCVLAAREHALRWEPRPHSVAAGSSPHVVPKIIHQMYKTADLPAKWADVPGAWAALHPPPEYQYVLWTDATLRELIAREYAWLLPTYDAYPHPTQRWDASRYAVLHRYGGLYVDLDVHPVRPVDELLRGQTLLLPYTPNIGLTNAIVAATPGHPFLSFALRELPTYARRWYHVTRHFEVLTSTGSTFIWAMHMRWARMHAREVAASLIPAPDWGKCSYCEAGRAADAAAAAIAAASAVASSARDGASALGSASSRHLGRLPPSAAPDGSSADTSATRWVSPLAHGEGSSWHAADSTIVLLTFCHSHAVLALALVVLTWRWTGSHRRAALVGLAMLIAVSVQHALGLVLLETFVGRPVVWLLMS